MDNKELATLLTEAALLLNEDEQILTEAAKFNFFPSFKKLTKKYPELKEAESLIDEGNDIIHEMGEVPTRSQIKSLLKFLLKILKYLNSIASTIMIPTLVTIVPIIPYTISRLITYLEEYGYTSLEQSEVKAQLEVIKSLIEKTTDKKQKERLQTHYDKLYEVYKKLS